MNARRTRPGSKPVAEHSDACGGCCRAGRRPLRCLSGVLAVLLIGGASLLAGCRSGDSADSAPPTEPEHWRFAIEETIGSVQHAYALKFEELIELPLGSRRRSIRLRGGCDRPGNRLQRRKFSADAKSVEEGPKRSLGSGWTCAVVADDQLD